MKTLNFLFAVKNSAGDDKLFQNLKNKLVNGINEQGICQVGHFDFVFTKENLVEKMKTKGYDIVLCSEELGIDKIGVGSLRSWMEEFPQVRVLLLINNNRKGNIKLIQLIQKLEYTDVLYLSDLNGESISRLVEKTRTLKEAVYYYGIENSEEIIASGILDGEDAEDMELVVENPEEVVEESVTKQETVVSSEKDGNTEESNDSSVDAVKVDLEAAIKAYENLNIFEEEIGENDKEEPVVEKTSDEDVGFGFDMEFVAEEAVSEKKTEPVEEVEENTISEGFDFFEKTSGEDDTVTYKEVEIPKEDVTGTLKEETICSVETTEVAEGANEEKNFGQVFENPAPDFLKQNESNISQGGLVVRTKMEQIISTNGYISKVIDEDSLLLEINTDGLAECGDAQSYRLLIRIKSGRKGVLENGRYRSANISLEAYVEYMVGKCTAMVEVVDFDCITNLPLIENKECTVILTKMG